MKFTSIRIKLKIADSYCKYTGRNEAKTASIYSYTCSLSNNAYTENIDYVRTYAQFTSSQ